MPPAEQLCSTCAAAVKDLGVVIDNRLTFNVHVQQIITKVFSRANLIYKCFTSRDTTLVHAFIVYVRPLRKYASSVRSPYHVGQTRSIEKVQQKVTKGLPGLIMHGLSAAPWD